MELCTSGCARNCNRMVIKVRIEKLKGTTDDDLTQKHYLLFGTHGTEQMPRSAVFHALRISTVICVFVFLYGGGGSLYCRLVCHRSNEPTTDARLVFIVYEGLGIDPAVEFGGVVVPFHQSLCSSA